MSQYINKVIVNGETRIDLTSDSVEPSSLLAGVSAHDKSGAPIVGVLEEKSVNDVIISEGTITIPPGVYKKGLTITLSNWLWDPLDFETSIITDATLSDIKEK